MTPRGEEVTVRNKRPLCSGQGRHEGNDKSERQGKCEGGRSTHAAASWARDHSWTVWDCVAQQDLTVGTTRRQVFT